MECYWEYGSLLDGFNVTPAFPTHWRSLSLSYIHLKHCHSSYKRLSVFFPCPDIINSSLFAGRNVRLPNKSFLLKSILYPMSKWRYEVSSLLVLHKYCFCVWSVTLLHFASLLTFAPDCIVVYIHTVQSVTVPDEVCGVLPVSLFHPLPQHIQTSCCFRAPSMSECIFCAASLRPADVEMFL